MISTLILRTTTRILTPVILVLSVFLLLRGHDAPGGGFIAALVAGAAVMLQYLANGVEGARRFLPLSFATILATGLLLAVGMGLVGLFAGEAFLQGALWRFHVPGIGEIKATASLVFDLGVYLVVVAMVVAIIQELGERPR